MKPIKIGVFGARRGLSFAQSAYEGQSRDLELSCICDFSDEKIKNAATKFNVDFYSDFDKMLESGIDAVVLANYFHEHTPYAIKALKAGIHVMSETTPAGTMAEAVELCDAAENSKATYMFAENYPFSKIGLAMKKEYDSGTIGKAVYGEGEYIHPIEASEFNRIAPGDNHWRNWIPSTYYSTHALAPLMYFTGTRPIRVNAFSVAESTVSKGTPRRNDPLAILICTMDDGSIFRITGWVTVGGHSAWCKLMGTKGTLEAPRQYDGGFFGSGMLHIMLNNLEPLNDRPFFSSYKPEWPEDSKDAEKTGHGGADYFMNKMFADSIRSGVLPPYFDVYNAAAMSAVGILGWKSALSNGLPIDIPDFRDKTAREAFRNDYSTPFPNDKGWPLLPTSVK